MALCGRGMRKLGSLQMLVKYKLQLSFKLKCWPFFKLQQRSVRQRFDDTEQSSDVDELEPFSLREALTLFQVDHSQIAIRHVQNEHVGGVWLCLAKVWGNSQYSVFGKVAAFSLGEAVTLFQVVVLNLPQSSTWKKSRRIRILGSTQKLVRRKPLHWE